MLDINIDMEYRLYEKGDEEEIVDLLFYVFNGWPKFDLPVSPLEHWKWKFLDNPYGSIIALSSDNDKIVGCQHTLFKNIKVGNNEYQSGIGVDVALHPDYRGRGEYGRLSDFKKSQEKSYGLKFRNFIQSHPNLIKKDRKLGNPLFPHNVHEFVRIKNIEEQFSGARAHFIKKLGFLFLSTINHTKNIVTRKYHINEKLDIFEIEEFDERIDDFYLRIKDSFKFIFLRDKEYLNWRYCDERGGRFKIYLVESDGEILGYLVLRINRYDENYPIGYLVDVLVDPSKKEVLLPLTEIMIDYFDENNVNCIKYWNVNNSIIKFLSNIGFIKNPIRLNYTFLKETLVMDDYSILLSSDVNEVHFTFGDHDHI